MAADTDLSGTLDVGEFRVAMRRFGEEMDGRAVGASPCPERAFLKAYEAVLA